MLIDKDLKFSEHVLSQCAKGNRMVNLIRRNFGKGLEKESFCILYKAIVRPILEYGSCVWSPYQMGNIKKIEQVQRRATRIVRGTRNMQYEERLKYYGLPTLEYRRLRKDMVTVYKILTQEGDGNGLIDIVGETRTRGHTKKMAKQGCKGDIRKHVFSNRVVTPWNSLPQHIVNLSSLNQFKEELNNHWRHNINKFHASCYI